MNLLNKFRLNGSGHFSGVVRHLSAIGNFKTHLSQELEGIKEAGLYRNERIILSRQDSYIRVQNSKLKVLNFCANNYLGLSNNPEIVEAVRKSLESRGFGLASGRIICGTQVTKKSFPFAYW